MAFAYQSHEAFFELNPGETKIWRLPPITPGTVILSSFYAMPPGWTGRSSTDEERRDNLSGPGRHASEVGPLRDARVSTTGGGVARDQPITPTHGTLGELEVLDEGGGSSGPTMELTLELLMGRQVVANHHNHILHQTPNSGDIWSLRISRKQDGSLERRRYRLHAAYPSMLAQETRRIPLRFFKRGFHEIWNTAPYIDWAYIKDNILSYHWNPQFAALYHMPEDDQHVPLGTGRVKLPHIKSVRIRLLAGGDADPNPVAPIPGEVRPERPYFALRIDCEYEGSRLVEFDVPGPNPDITLPEELWFEIRLFLGAAGQGTIGYTPRVLSPLLDMLDRNISYPTLSGSMETINVKTEIVTHLENYLYQLQNGPTGNGFDKYFRPWIVGRYAVENITYDRASEDMVVTYVAKRAAAPADPGRMVRDTEVSSGGNPEPEHPRLFETPDELPQQRSSGFGDPTPIRTVDPGALSKIKHIVVLMQENRSFDQILGYMSRDGLVPRDRLFSSLEGAPGEPPLPTPREPLQTHVDGLLPGDNPRDSITYPEGSSRRYRSSRRRTTSWPSFHLDNPCHGHDCVERQISDNMKGFIADYARKTQVPEELQLIMDYLTDEELPAFGFLAREFAICDHWFCSHIGGTLPNRFISLTGDLSEDVYGSPEVENPDLAGGFAPLEAPTFLDHLTTRGVSWKVFEHGYGMLRLMRKYTFDETNIVGFKNRNNGFVATALAGELPAVTFIEPDYIEMPDGNDDHAPADMMNGQRLIATIVKALVESPQWESTLLIITYDEHGGFYDHVPLPKQIEHTAPDGTVSRRDIPALSNGESRLGVRVPTFVISPFISAMADGKVNVSKTVYDHTSIPATILRTFCSPRPPSLGPRTDGAADLRELLTLDTARPRSEFDRLVRELDRIANRPAVALSGGMAPARLRKPAPGHLEDDFHGLIAFASSITGVGPR